jgi:hypothetical protein
MAGVDCRYGGWSTRLNLYVGFTYRPVGVGSAVGDDVGVEVEATGVGVAVAVAVGVAVAVREASAVEGGT